MLKKDDTAMNAATEAKITLTAPALGLASYYLFLVGMTLCALGMYSVGLALELTPPLAGESARRAAAICALRPLFPIWRVRLLVSQVSSGSG